MAKRIYRNAGAVEKATELVWDEIVLKFSRGGSDLTSQTRKRKKPWAELSAKRQRRLEKIMKGILKVTETIGRTRPPR